ncbi:hypothetical protein OROMI_014417 [Orobanche minor]
MRPHTEHFPLTVHAHRRPIFQEHHFKNSTRIRSIPDCRRAWPEFMKRHYSSIWIHEYKFHGACVVSNDTTYQVLKFQDAIIKDLQLIPSLKCGNNGTHTLLMEITLCIDDSAVNLVNCTYSAYSCGLSVVYKAL